MYRFVYPRNRGTNRQIRVLRMESDTPGSAEQQPHRFAWARAKGQTWVFDGDFFWCAL